MPRPERVFLDWSEPTARAAAGWLRERRGSVIAIVPTQAAGRRLRRELGSNAQVEVHTPAGFLEARESDIADPFTATLALANELARPRAARCTALFPAGVPARNFSERLALAKQVRRVQADLATHGLTIGEAAGRFVGTVDHGRWRDMVALIESADATLHRAGLREREAARLQTLREPQLSPGIGEVAVVCVADIPAAVTAALEKLPQPVTVLIAGPGKPDVFDEWGRPTPDEWLNRNPGWRSFDDQVRLVADPDRVEVSLEGEVAIGLLDRQMLPALEDAAAALDRRIHDPTGRLLSGYWLSRTLAAFPRLATEPAFSEAIDLLRNGAVRAWIERGVPGVDFDAALLAADRMKASHFPASLREAQRWMRRETALSDALEPIEKALTDLGDNPLPTLRRLADELSDAFGPRLDGDELELLSDARKTIGEALERLEASVPIHPELSIGDWLHALREVLDSTRIYPLRKSDSIEASGWLELPWSDAPRLILAGMNLGTVPASSGPDILLGESARTRLGIPGDEVRRARDAYFLARLLAIPRQVEVLVLKSDAEGSPLAPSPLLFAGAGEDLPVRVERLFADPPPPPPDPAWSAGWMLDPPVVELPRMIAVTDFQRYLDCPFTFYLGRVAKIELFDPAVDELDAAQFGDLLHTALQGWAQDGSVCDSTDSAAILRSIDAHLRGWVERNLGRRLPLPLRLQIESAHARLAAFAEWQARDRAEGWRIRSVEQSFENLLGRPWELDGWVIRGRIDRIDENERDGRWRVIDYKTFDAADGPARKHLRAFRAADRIWPPEYARVEATAQWWTNLQLPLYRQLVIESGRSTAADCGYFNLPKTIADTGLQLWEDLDDALQESAMTCARGVLADLARRKFWPPNSRAAYAEFAECFSPDATRVIDLQGAFVRSCAS